MRSLTKILGLVFLLSGCAGMHLVPLRGQSDTQRKQDFYECHDLAVTAAKAAKSAAIAKARAENQAARDARTAGEQTAHVAGEVAKALILPFGWTGVYNDETPGEAGSRAYWATLRATNAQCYETRGYRYDINAGGWSGSNGVKP